MVVVVTQSTLSSPTKACAIIPYVEEPALFILLVAFVFVVDELNVNADDDGIRCLEYPKSVVNDECMNVEFVGVLSRILVFGLFPEDDKDDRRLLYDDDEPDVNGNEANEEDKVGDERGGKVLGGCSKLLSVCLLLLEVVAAMNKVDAKDLIKVGSLGSMAFPDPSSNELDSSTPLEVSVGVTVASEISSGASFFSVDTNLV